jgi:integrase
MDLSPGQRAALDKITAELAAAAGPALPGTLIVRAYACGKARCRCHADPPQLHGPYAEWTRKIGGKTITRRLTEAELAGWQPLFDNAKRLRALLADLQELTLAIVEASEDQEPQPAKPGQNPVGTARLTCDQPARQLPSAQLRAKRDETWPASQPASQKGQLAGRPSKSLTLEQAVALMDAAKGTRLEAYITFSLLAGLRTEEVRALRWDHVAWTDG